jgi:hypothetical protein
LLLQYKKLLEAGKGASIVANGNQCDEKHHSGKDISESSGCCDEKYR